MYFAPAIRQSLTVLFFCLFFCFEKIWWEILRLCLLNLYRQNASSRSVGYVAFLYIVVLLQVADGNVEDLERFLLSIQDCISYIERCTAPGNDRNMECKHDRLEGFVEIIAAFSLVLANVQGFLEIKVLVDDLPHFLRELLNHIRHKNTASFQVSAEFRSVPYRERSSLGRPKYNITAERIDVLRSTGMQ